MVISVEPEDAIAGLIATYFRRSVWKFNLVATKGSSKRNIISSDEYASFTPPTKYFLVIAIPGPALHTSYGNYSHEINKRPVEIEVHAEGNKTMCVAGKNEVMRIIKLYRKTIGTIYSDYRKIWITNPGQNIGTSGKPKYLIKIELEEDLQAL